MFRIIRQICALMLASVLGLIMFAPKTWAATALSACQTISVADNYTVSKNLTTSGDCFVISVSNVALDLKGHTIKGDGTGSAITNTTTTHNLAILNGKLLNFNRGIYFTHFAFNTTIDRITVSGMTADGIYMSGDDDTVTNTKSTNNGGEGIHISNCCNTFSDLQANDNTGNGVFAGSCCNLASKVTAMRNGGIGIELNSSENLYDNVKSSQNTGAGLHSSSGDEYVRNSTVTSNTGNGVEFVGCCSSVDNSTVSNNGADGFHSTSYNLLTNSTFNGNAGDGINATSIESIVLNVVANKNDVGVSIKCKANVVNLAAKGNATSNLVEDTGGGQCVNVNNKAP